MGFNKYRMMSGKTLSLFGGASSKGTNRSVVQAMDMAFTKAWRQEKSALESWQNNSK